jgi:hypothetical protein
MPGYRGFSDQAAYETVVHLGDEVRSGPIFRWETGRPRPLPTAIQDANRRLIVGRYGTDGGLWVRVLLPLADHRSR